MDNHPGHWQEWGEKKRLSLQLCNHQEGHSKSYGWSDCKLIDAVLVLVHPPATYPGDLDSAAGHATPHQ